MKSIREILLNCEAQGGITNNIWLLIDLDQAEKEIQEIINRKIREALEEGKLMGKDLGGGK